MFHAGNADTHDSLTIEVVDAESVDKHVLWQVGNGNRAQDAEGVDKRAAFEAADVEEAVEFPESLETLIPVHTAMAAQRRPITCAASVFFFMWNIFSCEH